MLESYETPAGGNAPPVAVLRQTDKRMTPDQRLYVCPEDSDVLYMTNEIKPDVAPLAIIDNAETWHADGSHKIEPYEAVIVHVVRNPARGGGETEFCDMRALYDALPTDVKKALRNQIAIHHWSKSRNPRFATSLDAAAMEEGERIASRFPEMSQPLICWDDKGKRAYLYLSPRFTIRLDGVPAEISTAMLDTLFSLMEEPAFIYRHVWLDGDLLIWDNRRTVHRVQAYEADDIRSRYRVTVSGDTPMDPYSGQAG
jgi:taurine dioxygenase